MDQSIKREEQLTHDEQKALELICDGDFSVFQYFGLGNSLFEISDFAPKYNREWGED